MKAILSIAVAVCLFVVSESQAGCFGSCGLQARPLQAVARFQPVRYVVSVRPLQRVGAWRPGQRAVEAVRRPFSRMLGPGR